MAVYYLLPFIKILHLIIQIHQRDPRKGSLWCICLIGKYAELTKVCNSVFTKSLYPFRNLYKTLITSAASLYRIKMTEYGYNNFIGNFQNY
jgi:hypothetical protein